MIYLYIISFLLFAAGSVLILKLTPDRVSEDVLKVIFKKPTLRDSVRRAQGKRKTGRITKELNHIRDALNTTGKGAKFTLLITASLIMMILGCVAAMAVGNPFLIPVLSCSFGAIPFIYAKKTIALYDTQVRNELETALSIITTSYMRSDDIVAAVSENTEYLKPPVRGIFESFVADCTVITSDTRQSIKRLKDRIKEPIFAEWCEVLAACQDDRTLKDTLMPVVALLTDARIVNNDLKTMMSETRREYYMMVLLVLANIPLLLLLNPEWFNTLVGTTAGKVVLAICGMTIAVTAVLMSRYTQPVTYEKPE